MNEKIRKKRVSRVLVAVDPSVHGCATMESAATFAVRLQAELVALFVEDLNLIHLAGLPFASEIDRSSGRTRQLDSKQMARALRVQAEQTRRALQRIGEQRKIRTSLKIVRGHYVAEALSAASTMDVSFLFRMGHNRKISAMQPVWVLYDGSTGAQSALAMAKKLTVAEENDLVVLLVAHKNSVLAELQAEADERLGDRASSARFKYLASNDLADLQQAVREEGGSLLLMARDNALLTARDAQQLIDAMDCPVVLVA